MKWNHVTYVKCFLKNKILLLAHIAIIFFVLAALIDILKTKLISTSIKTENKILVWFVLLVLKNVNVNVAKAMIF